MQKYFNIVSMFLSVVGGAIGYWCGGYDTLLKTIIMLVVLDYATGIIRAIYKKNVSSTLCFGGILKKITIFIIIAMSFTIQKLIGGAIPLREVVIMFFIGNEGISVLENASQVIKVPKQLKDVLLQIREESEDTEEK